MKMIYLFLLIYPLLATAESEVMKYLRLGCENQKQALGCYHYANLLRQNGEAQKSDEYFQKGCNLGNQNACSKTVWTSSPRSAERSIAGSVEPNMETQTEKKIDVDKNQIETTTKAQMPGLKLKITTKEKKSSIDVADKKREPFIKAFTDCSPSTYQFDHPLMKNFIVEEKILGMEGDICKYTQTMPNNGLMTCGFDEANLRAIASDSSQLNLLMTKPSVCQISGY